MAIQMRRGKYELLDPSKLMPGEWAIVLESDPSGTGGRSLYMCFSPGVVKRIATVEDMATIIANAEQEVSASTAKSTADAAQAKADDAWARTLRVQVSSAPADAAGDTSKLTATVWRGGELLSYEAVAGMGLLAWYVGGRRVATGGTYTCAAGTAVECRLEA